ncbi:uncharacterized protein METZ01_LOCUS262083 [marine metagenome]|uniref:Uncharacterized protein n=1 Tax=marine metagenome TaxID=408172 RepID=A0A382JC50_9ZZZZ
MKLLITTIAAVLLAGCGGGQQSSSPVEAELTEPVAEPIVEAEPTTEINKTANPQADRALRDAITKGDVEAVKQQLVAGADVNATHNGGGTPLHRAAREGHKQIVELLYRQWCKM